MMSVFSLLQWILTFFASIFSIFSFNTPKTEVELYHNPSSGYRWEYEMDNEDILTFSESHYTPDKDSALSGKGGGTQHFTFKSKNEGTVSITFRYYKYDNGEKVVISQYIYSYSVNKNGEITLNSVK